MYRIPNEWRYWDCETELKFPWYTQPALLALEKIDFVGKRLFEYGVGDSTTWYRKKGAILFGVDSNQEWATKANAMFCENQEEYTKSIEAFSTSGLFDIVVIDGVHRDECTEPALRHLKPGGMLIIDNYKQPSVQADWPLTEKLIEGMRVEYFREPEHEDWQTIIVYK